MFDNTAETVKLFSSALLAAGVNSIDSSFKYVLVLIILMAVDTIFGWVKGRKLKKWNSGAARWGAIGKIIELIFVGTLYILDWVFGLDFLKHMGVFYFGVCELASIAENYTEINSNLPEAIPEILKRLQFSIGTVLVGKLKNVITAVFENKNGGDKNE